MIFTDRRRVLGVALTATLVVTAEGVLRARQAPADPVTLRGLAIKYADGRVITRPVLRTGGMWTPIFPRVPGASPAKDGLPLSTLDVRHQPDGTDLLVTVRLSYGRPDRNLVEVASVRVTPAAAVRVDELRAYGVEPIELSIVPIPPGAASLPEGVAVSPRVDVRVALIGGNDAAYRVTVVNRSEIPLMWIRWAAVGGGKPRITARPRGKRNLPLVGPHAEHTFDVPVGTRRGPDEPQESSLGIERFEITSLMWADGVVEGAREPAVQQHRFESGRAASLRRFVTLLGGYTGHSMSPLQAQIAGTLDFDAETRAFREDVLADLAEMKATGRSRQGLAFAEWRTETIAEAQRWLARIVLPRL